MTRVRNTEKVVGLREYRSWKKSRVIRVGVLED